MDSMLIVTVVYAVSSGGFMIPTHFNESNPLVDESGTRITADCNVLGSHLTELRDKILTTPITSVAGNGELCFSTSCAPTANVVLTVNENAHTWEVRVNGVSTIRGNYSDNSAITFDNVMTIDSIADVSPGIVGVLDQLCPNTSEAVSEAYLTSWLNKDLVLGTLTVNASYWTLKITSALAGTLSSDKININPTLSDVQAATFSDSESMIETIELYSHYHHDYSHDTGAIIVIALVLIGIPLFLISVYGCMAY